MDRRRRKGPTEYSGRMVKRCILDTNAIIALLQGRPVMESLPAVEWIGVSVVSILEFLSFPEIMPNDLKLLDKFLSRVTVIDLNFEDNPLIKLSVEIRKLHKLKLPDAIIAATAIRNKAVLVTEDKHFLGVKNLKIVGW